MSMGTKQNRDAASGLLFLFTGLAFALAALNYDQGSVSAPGPGFFPLLLSCCLTILGAAITWRAWRVKLVSHTSFAPINLRAAGLTLASCMVFGALLEGVQWIGLPPMGLATAIFVSTFLSSVAQTQWTLKASLVLSATLSTLGCLVFVGFLELGLNAWPHWSGT